MIKVNSSILKALSSNELRVWEYIEKNTKNILNMNLQELANSTFVSTTTIIRLCKKLGLEGFNELKYNLKKYKQEEISPDLSLALNGLLSSSLDELKFTVNNISMENINKTVDYLSSNKTIHLFAKGLSEMPFNYMYNILLSVDRYYYQYDDPPLMLITASQMTDNDVLIIGSCQGSTEPIIKAAITAKKQGATVIAITSNMESILAKTADIVFYAKTEKRYLHNIDIMSRLNLSFIIETIINCYLNRMNLHKIKK